jgi:hypothetical protein
MLAWLAHPISALGLVTLTLNDHVFKAAWPGPVTGKLSDFAGMLMFPPLLASVLALALPRLPVRPLALTSLVLTGLAFAAAKGFTAGAEVAEALWSVARGPSQFLADPTDLIALPALLLSGWAFSRTTALADGVVRSLLLLLLLPAGLLATTATSPADYPNAIWVGEVDGRLVMGDGPHDGPALRYDGTASRPDDLFYSDDAGLTWDREIELMHPPTSIASLDPLSPTPSSTPSLSPSLSPSPIALVDRLPTMLTSDCAPTVCYRVVPGELHVQRSTDGGQRWETEWRVSGLRYARLVAGYSDLGDPAVHLSSLGLVMHETAGGQHVVLVANGRDGILRRDEAGNWDRQDASVPLTSAPAAVLYYVMLALAVVLLVLFVPLRRLSPAQPLPSTAQALRVLASLLVPLAVATTTIAVFYQAESMSGGSIVFTVLALVTEASWVVTMCRVGRLPVLRLGWGLVIAVTTALLAVYALRRPLEEAFILPDLEAMALGSFIVLTGAVTLNVLAGRLRRSLVDRDEAIIARWEDRPSG